MSKTNYIFSIFILILFFSLGSCNKSDSDIIVWRKITSEIMVNGYGAYLFIKAEPDSVLYRGIHIAELQAKIFNISDTLEILGFGHVWSINNPNPTIKTASKVFTSDSVSFNPNDSIIAYTSLLSGLELDTGYYARCFLIYKEENSGKVDTAYNQIVTQFRTLIPEDIWFYSGEMKVSGGSPLESRTEAVVAQVYDSQYDKYSVYMGLGYNGYMLLRDFYSYNQEDEVWTQKAQFLGPPRYKAVSFVIENNIYVGTGKTSISIDTSYSRDFYKYNINSNQWIQIGSMPENTGRYGAIAWSIYDENKWWGFVGLGKRNYARSDFFRYNYSGEDPANPQDTSLWILYSFSNTINARYDAIAISNGEIAFLGGGYNGSRVFNDYYLYNPADNNSLNPIINVPLQARYNAVANYVEFDRRGKNYKYFFIGTGQVDDNTFLNDWYAYDLINKKWYEKSYIHEDFHEASPRAGAISFILKRDVVQYGLKIRIYVAGGHTQDGLLNDMWEYLP